jgi:hypothetical protein
MRNDNQFKADGEKGMAAARWNRLRGKYCTYSFSNMAIFPEVAPAALQ